MPPLRLRHKLGISLVITALLPVLVASWVAVSVVLRSLNVGLQDDTNRQLHVGINLLLRNVERLGHEASRLSRTPELAGALAAGPVQLGEVLADISPHLPSCLIQVADAQGVIQGQRVAGEAIDRFQNLGVGSSSPLVEAGRKFERRVTIVPSGGQLVVRASAPVVDPSFELLGVVVLSMPLDAAVAEEVKAALGADVLVFAGIEPDTPGTSTFADEIGRPVSDLSVPADVARELRRGRTVFRTSSIHDHEYALGYAPIISMNAEIVGVFAVAVDRAPLGSARAAATRSLALGAAGAFVFALGLAGLLSRRITRPIANLHQGAVAIARGDLDHEIEVSEGDEIGDLAAAFSHMTSALKDNQRRLAARMREIVALHDAGRAVSSVLDLEQVLRKIVDSVARVLHVRVCALWLVEGTGMRLGAARAKRGDMRTITRGEEVAQLVQPLASIAAEVGTSRAPIRILRVVDDEARAEAAVAAGVTGSLVATPLERKGNVLGVIIIGRARDARAFSEADANLLATFADQAATAIENASLYQQVRSWSEELEKKVELRTAELTTMNQELGRTIVELRDTQAQLILSERLAGVGQLVAGVAHEINSPSAAIRGTVEGLVEQVRRLTAISSQLAPLALSEVELEALIGLAAEMAPRAGARRVPSPAAVRRAARELLGELEAAGLGDEDAAEVARQLAELGAGEEATARLRSLAAPVVGSDSSAEAGRRARLMVGYVSEYVHLHRGVSAIEHAIRRIQRIVGGLKSYSHLDQDAGAQEADIHEGIEQTVELLDHLLAHGITVTRRYGAIPRVPVYVDELNQVWTNLIHNAVQALDGQGEIAIETEEVEGGVVVRVIDDGPGISQEVRPRLFEPFFTTKPRGEGSGLGLSIVRRILDRHGGKITVESLPGRTCFEVWLPRRPQAAAPGTA
jgi:signal transduction histidine kinase